MTEETHWNEQGDHPSLEKLGAYLDGELSSEENDEIQEHLVECDFCTQALLDLKTFLDFPEGVSSREGVADLGAAAEWRDLWKRIEENRRPGQERDAPSAPLRRFLASRRVAYSLAAACAAAALGLSLYVQSLRQEQKAFDRNPHLVYLNAATVRGGDDTTKTLELPPGESGSIILNLGLPEDATDPEYRVEIQRKGDRPIFEESGLKPQEGEVLFAVSPRLFETGRYEIVLWKPQQREPGPVSRYELEVVRKK